MKLTNQDPSRVYALPYKGDDSVADYEAMGYRIEERTPDGVNFLHGKTSRIGQPLEMRGHVLMSIDKSTHQDIVQHGPDGNTGQEYADLIDSKIIDRSGGIPHDPSRGLHGYEVHNETKPLVTEG